MRLSKKCEYALRALFVIARRPERQFQIQELSRQENIPVKFLEQILLSLRHAGILTSKRGVGGGYQLRRPPGEITVREIIRLFDGAPVLPPPSSRPDPFTFLLRELQTEEDALLNSRTIEDVLEQVPADAALSFEI